VQIVSCGVPLVFAALGSRRAVDSVSIDRRAFADACKAAGFEELPMFLFTSDRAASTGDEAVCSLHPGDVVVLDNLAVHKQPEVHTAIAAVGAGCGICRPTARTSIVDRTRLCEIESVSTRGATTDL
jgi:hypothetical protein